MVILQDSEAKMTSTGHIEKAYSLAKESYAVMGVDTDDVIEKLPRIAICPLGLFGIITA
jgi:hypothetical protein